MTETPTGTILRKRLSPPRPVRRVDESQLEKILEVEMPRGADTLLALEVSVQAVTQVSGSAAEVVESLGEADLVSLMTSEEQGAGLIVIDPALMAAVIEVQTLGKVSAAPVAERTPTRIDMLILSDLVDRWMTDIRTAAEHLGCTDAVTFITHTRAPRELSVRAVELMLEPVVYRITRISLALGGGAKTGTLTFVVPASGVSGQRSAGGSMGQKLVPHLMDAHVTLNAVLDRVEMPLDEILALETGRVIAVSRDRLATVSLEAEGRELETTRLGQFCGKRAVRRGAAEDALPMAVPAAAPMLGSAEVTATAALPASEEGGGDIPSLPDLPEPAAVSPEISDTSAAALPDLPELTDLPEEGMLPELPDLPDLPDLPEP